MKASPMQNELVTHICYPHNNVTRFCLCVHFPLYVVFILFHTTYPVHSYTPFLLLYQGFLLEKARKPVMDIYVMQQQP